VPELGEDQEPGLSAALTRRSSCQRSIRRAMACRREAVSPCVLVQPDPPARSPASMERRRSWASSGHMPPQVARRFTLGEQAVLAVIARQVVQHGACTLTIGHIAEQIVVHWQREISWGKGGGASNYIEIGNKEYRRRRGGHFVFVQRPGAATSGWSAAWNNGESHAHNELGELKLVKDCWINDRAKICIGDAKPMATNGR
jgi:hypothetical protein